MAHTRLVKGKMITPSGEPFVGFVVNFTVTPSQTTPDGEWPLATESVTTDANGEYEIELGIGITYTVLQFTAAASAPGSMVSYTQGRLYEITIPDGTVPITMAELVLSGTVVDPTSPALTDAVLAGLPPLIHPLVTEDLRTNPELVTLIESTSEAQTVAIVGDMEDRLQADIDAKADATALVPLDAHVADVTTNPHKVTKSQVGLANVPNVDATDRANHTGTQAASTISDFAAAADARITAARNTAGGVAGLDAEGYVDVNHLRPIAITDVYTVGSESAMLALVAEQGDMAIRTDLSRSFVHNGGDTGTVADWTEMLSPADDVLSVNGKIGAVVLGKADVGLGNVDNTSDTDKPVSGPTAAALATKADDADLTAHITDTDNPHGVTAAQTGAYTTGQVDAAMAGKAPAVAALGVCVHGSDPDVPRPVGYAAVMWVGSAEPSAMVNGDVWTVVP